MSSSVPPVTQVTPDRISQVMGQNLLKGFALLDEYCNVCQTPLMRDPGKNLLCVACHLMRPQNTNCAQSGGGPKSSAAQIEAFSESALRKKLEWAVRQLHDTTDVKLCIELNVLIKALLENVRLMRELE